jgi:phenylpropionate dioxygenase-like ring-hydroxylating dioxygenase large terminal subunit
MIDPSLSAPLSPEWYWHPEFLERERQEVFFKSWIFAGLAEQLAKPNDYVSFTIAGLPVIVRNMKGKLFAFRNVCSHRHSTIHPVGCGNAMFRCPYHGWTYDADGVPIGVPDNAKSFGFDKAAKQELALEQFSVDRCGNFIFVRVAAEGPPLRQWLGTFFEPLEHISMTLTANYATIDQRWNCNWKNRLEVVIEGYHLPFVHKASMSQHVAGVIVPDTNAEDVEDISASLDMELHVDNEGSRQEFTGPHSADFAPLVGPSLHHLDTIAKRLRAPTSSRLRGYDHFMLFPNMMFGINGGVNMCIERYEPVSAEQTDVQCWLMVGTPTEAGIKDGIIWNQMTQKWKEWTEKVLAEDRAPCETTQLGIRYARHRALLGEVEERVRRFQLALRERVERKEMAA